MKNANFAGKGEIKFMTIKIGRYRHYKGNNYAILGIARHSETLEELVLYKELYGEGQLWARPADLFEETVPIGEKEIPRFSYINNKEYNTLLFDLDGTLTDSAEGITNSVRYALAKFGLHEEPNQLIKYIGPPLIDSFMQFAELSKEQALDAVKYYREYFADKGIFENKVYEGIPELLDSLQKEGKELVIATSKPTVFTERILEHFDLQKYFSLVVGSNLDGTRMKKAEIIQYIIDALPNRNKEQMLMIGDREHDCIGAKECGIDCASVLYGFGTLAELEAQQPTFIVEKVEDLRLLLASY